jgi:hypothetical protein
MVNFLIIIPKIKGEARYNMKNRALLILLFLSMSLLPLPLHAQAHQGPKAASARDAGPPVYPLMPEPGQKVTIGAGRYMIYGFDRQPKMGTVIVKVQIYKDDGNKDTTLSVTADSGMPSMRGAHESGDRPFQLSKKGDYLLPINIVMPGDWEIRLTIMKDGKVIFRGRDDFDV